jgi:hypothetical protein
MLVSAFAKKAFNVEKPQNKHKQYITRSLEMAQRSGVKMMGKRAAKDTKLGRHSAACAMREDLFRWFTSIRKSVKGRIPKRLLKYQAERCRESTLLASLRHGVKTRLPQITPKWIKLWMKEYHVSLRKPSKRWKVPFPIFMERLRVFW